MGQLRISNHRGWSSWLDFIYLFIFVKGLDKHQLACERGEDVSCGLSEYIYTIYTQKG